MATLDKIKVGGVDYDIVDSQARADISTLKSGGVTKDELDTKQDKLDEYVAKVQQGYMDWGVEFVSKDSFGRENRDSLYFKTINGQKIWSLNNGAGANIEIDVDTSKLATKEELNGKQDKIDGTFVGNFETDGNSIKYENYEFSDYRGGGELNWIDFKTINGEDILGEGNISVQGKLQGDYVKDVEIGGGYITFNSMKFDGNNNGVKTANFKTINNQPILGSGNIDIDVDTSNLAPKSDLGGLKLVKITQIEYDTLTNKDENTLYVIYD